MTFFLGEKIDIKRRGPNVALPSNPEAMSAAARNYWQSVNVFWQRERQVVNERDSVALQAAKSMSADGLAAFVDEFNQRAETSGQTERKLRPGMTPEEVMAAVGPNGSKRLIEMARERAAQEPALGDVDLTDEGIEARVTERRKAEAAADAELIALSPNPIRNEILGSLGAGIADPVNLALVPFGLGGGSLLRVMGREALLGATAEAVQFPTRTRVAAELDQEAPDFLQSVTLGALAGGILGGVVDGVPRLFRGIAAAREARKLEPTADISPATHEQAVQVAERAIAEGRPVDKAVADVVLADAAPARRPLILDESMAVTPEPTPLAPDPITEMPLAPVPGIQSTTDQIVATAESGLRKAAKPKKEVLGWLKRQGVDPQGWLGTELKARGMTHKSMPGLFKKGGLKDIDNIVADELDQSIPGVSWRAGRDDTGNYLDREGLLRLVDEELGTPRKKPYGREYDPQKAWADPDTEDRGFMVDLNARQFAEPETWRETLNADVDAYLAKKGWDMELLPREIDEIKAAVGRSGGDVDDMVISAMSREVDEAEYATLRSMRGEAYGRPASEVPWGDEAGLRAGEDRQGGNASGEPQAAAGDAPEPGARDPGFAVERTDIGDQYVIPGSREPAGVDRQRQQAEIAARQIQSKIRRLNQARVEDDVDGLFATRTMDLFDDITSPQAQAYMDAELVNMRAALEEGDLEVAAVADDGRALGSLSEVLDEIDEMDALVREYAKCRGGATE